MPLFGTSTDLWTYINNFATNASKAGSVLLVLVVGFMCLKHVSQVAISLLVVVFVIAMIPAFLLMDPGGAATFLKNTAESL